MKVKSKLILQDGIETAQEMINELKMQSQWRNVSKELPEKEDHYFVITWPDKSYTPYTAFYSRELSSWKFCGETKFPTHWMPLPEPPKPN